jgi:hypothetical protein
MYLSIILSLKSFLLRILDIVLSALFCLDSEIFVYFQRCFTHDNYFIVQCFGCELYEILFFKYYILYKQVVPVAEYDVTSSDHYCNS